MSISTPTLYHIKQTDVMEQFCYEDRYITHRDKGQTEFNSFTLLDNAKTDFQTYFATHVSFGSYHAGVVCNDVDTNYEFEELPLSQQVYLDKFKEFLLNSWNTLEKESNPPNEEIIRIQKQYYHTQKTLSGVQGKDKSNDLQYREGYVSENLKVEYMLRFFFLTNYTSYTYPYVPLQNIKDVMSNQAKMSFKDPKSINKLFSHFKNCAAKTLNSPRFK